MVEKILVIKSEKKTLDRSENEKKATSKFSKILEKCNNSNKYKLSIHKTNGFWYASTQSYTIDPKTGKKKYTHTHWGTLTHNLEFYPNEIYWFADQSLFARSLVRKILNIKKLKKSLFNSLWFL